MPGTLETLEAMLAEAQAEVRRRVVTVEARNAGVKEARKVLEERKGLRDIADGLGEIALERVAALEDAIAALRDCL